MSEKIYAVVYKSADPDYFDMGLYSSRESALRDIVEHYAIAVSDIDYQGDIVECQLDKPAGYFYISWRDGECFEGRILEKEVR